MDNFAHQTTRMIPAPGSRLPAPGSRLPAPGSRLPALLALAIALFSLNSPLAHGVDNLVFDGTTTFYTFTDENTTIGYITFHNQYGYIYLQPLPDLPFPDTVPYANVTFEYVALTLTPQKGDVYYVGVMESEVHPVLTLYESPFDPTQPELGMIAYNLGVSEAEHRAVLGDDKSLEFVVADPEWPVDWFQLPDGDLVSLFPGRPADWPSYCGSQISFKGLAGQSYSLIIVTSLPDGNWRLCTPMKIYVTGTVEKQEPEPSGKTEEPEGTETSGESGDSPDETETPNGLETLEGQPSLFHGALAELGMEVDRICWGLGYCNKLHPRPKAWFFRGFHSHLHRNGAENSGYHGDISGGIVGGDRVRTISQKTLLCSGMRASYANVRMRSFANGAKIHQIRMGGALFGQLQHRSARQMLSAFHATVGGGYSHGRTSREGILGNSLAARFGGEQVFAALEVSQELFRLCGWHIGPKMGAEYGWQRQNGYAENGGSGALRIGNVDHRFFTTALGVGLARTFSGGSGSKCGHISLAITWRCQAMRNHSNPTAYEQGSTTELFPIIGYGARSSAAISLAICRHFDRHWSGKLSWSEDFAHGRRDGHASAQLSYEF